MSEPADDPLKWLFKNDLEFKKTMVVTQIEYDIRDTFRTKLDELSYEDRNYVIDLIMRGLNESK